MISTQLYSTLLVLPGSLFLLASLMITKGMRKKSVPQAIRAKWSALTWLISFFLTGYIAFLVIQFTPLPFPLELLTSTVFLGGAIFVYLVMRLTGSAMKKISENEGYIKEFNQNPYCHHEKWDGTGYPRGLKGEQIPIAARIFALSDIWDALITERRYRKAWPKEKVVGYIKSLTGTHFDPNLLEVFLTHV